MRLPGVLLDIIDPIGSHQRSISGASKAGAYGHAAPRDRLGSLLVVSKALFFGKLFLLVEEEQSESVDHQAQFAFGAAEAIPR